MFIIIKMITVFIVIINYNSLFALEQNISNNGQLEIIKEIIVHNSLKQSNAEELQEIEKKYEKYCSYSDSQYIEMLKNTCNSSIESIIPEQNCNQIEEILKTQPQLVLLARFYACLQLCNNNKNVNKSICNDNAAWRNIIKKDIESQ